MSSHHSLQCLNINEQTQNAVCWLVNRTTGALKEVYQYVLWPCENDIIQCLTAFNGTDLVHTCGRHYLIIQNTAHAVKLYKRSDQIQFCPCALSNNTVHPLKAKLLSDGLQAYHRYGTGLQQFI